MNTRLIMFSSLKLYHVLLKYIRAASKEVASTAGEKSLYICLVEDKQHLQARHLLPFSPADRRTFGLIVHESIQPWPRSDKGQGAQLSGFHRNTLTTPPVTELHSKRTPHFVSQHGLFSHTISTAIGVYKGWRMGIQGVMQVLQDGDCST